MMAVYGYMRVSTAEQAEDGRSSLDSQAQVIRGVAMVKGWGDVDVRCDAGVSGSIPLRERPAGRDLDLALKEGDVLIAAKLDRLFRSASDALASVEAFQRRGIRVVMADMGTDSVTENGMSKLFFSMVAAFAEFERTRIAERMTEGRRAKRGKGGHVGGYAPYGYRKVGSGREALIEEEPDEREIVERMIWLRDHDGLGYRAIAEHLTVNGIRTRAGTPFDKTQVWRILRRVDDEAKVR